MAGVEGAGKKAGIFFLGEEDADSECKTAGLEWTGRRSVRLYNFRTALSEQVTRKAGLNSHDSTKFGTNVEQERPDGYERVVRPVVGRAPPARGFEQVLVQRVREYRGNSRKPPQGRTANGQAKKKTINTKNPDHGKAKQNSPDT